MRLFPGASQPHGMVLVPGPLGQVILEVQDPGTIEYMTSWLECVRHLGGVSEIEQCGEGKPHSAPFIGNGGSTFAAADLTGQDAFVPASLATEKVQVVHTGGKPHMVLVKDGGPLHWGTVQFLARETVTNFGIHGIGVHFVSNGPTKAGRSVLGYKGRIVEGRVFIS